MDKGFREKVAEARADFIDEESETLLELYADYSRDLEVYDKSSTRWDFANVNAYAIKGILLERLGVK